MEKKPTNTTCIGMGLVALDVLFNGTPNFASGLFAGGSCGNVMAILSYLGWNTFPIARLRNNEAGKIVLKDLEDCGVNSSFISLQEDGSTPIIIHRVLTDKYGKPKHRFEFRDPDSGDYLPSYKPVLSASVESIMHTKPDSKVFYFDRVNRASAEVAKRSKEEGTIVFFEPSSIKEDKLHLECLSYSDIVKFSSDRISNYNDLYPICLRELEIMTLGVEGLAFRTKHQEEWTYVPAFVVNGVVDAAGSGDWCSSGIIYCLFSSASESYFEKENIENAIQFGQTLGALNCCYLGARGIMYAMNKNIFWDNINTFTSNTDSFCNNSANSFRSVAKEINLHSLY